MDIEKKFSVAEWPSHELHLKGRKLLEYQDLPLTEYQLSKNRPGNECKT